MKVTKDTEAQKVEDSAGAEYRLDSKSIQGGQLPEHFLSEAEKSKYARKFKYLYNRGCVRSEI
jgi:hypothetical protein